MLQVIFFLIILVTTWARIGMIVLSSPSSSMIQFRMGCSNRALSCRIFVLVFLFFSILWLCLLILRNCQSLNLTYWTRVSSVHSIETHSTLQITLGYQGTLFEGGHLLTWNCSCIEYRMLSIVIILLSSFPENISIKHGTIAFWTGSRILM